MIYKNKRTKEFVAADKTSNHKTYILEILESLVKTVGCNSSVGIATSYGLDGPAIESRWGRDFPHLSRPALGSSQPSVQWIPGLSRW